MASVEALAPRPNDVVLDCCAAPGSKTTQLVERCEGGCVVAVEYDAKRARALVARSLHVCGGDRAARLIVCKGDATKLPSSQRFDRVLCDVPCSGDGALRKSPPGRSVAGVGASAVHVGGGALALKAKR